MKILAYFQMVAALPHNSFQRDCDGRKQLNIPLSVHLSKIGFIVYQSDLMHMNYLILASIQLQFL